MQSENPEGSSDDRAVGILEWARHLLASSASATPEEILSDLAVAAHASTVLLARPHGSGTIAAQTGEKAIPPAPPDRRSTTARMATCVSAPDGAVWLLAATGMSGTPEWLLWLRRDASRTWTDGERAALVLAADAIHRHLLSGPTTAPASRQNRLEHAAEVSARIAHDYGNVLTSILGFAELGLSELNRHDPGVFYLTEVRRAAQEGSRFTDRLRQFGRPGQGKTVPAPLDLVLGDEARRLARETGDAVTVQLALPPDLPMIAISPELLRLLFAELFDNARDAVGRRGPVTVRACSATLTSAECLTLHGSPSPGPCVEVTVEDGGPGFTPEARLRVLADPLYSTKPKHRGLGLGIAAGIARANGAGLRLEPGVAGGTVVRVFLPRSAQQELSRTEQNRVLVIDDDAMVLRFVALVLAGAGYAVETANSGTEALQASRGRASPFDLALVDVCMPGLDGVETVQRLRRTVPRLPVLFMSSQTLPETACPLITGGPQNFLQKPFRPDRLVELVRQALRAPIEQTAVSSRA